MFFIPTSLVSIFMNIKQKLIKWKTGLVVSLFGAVGAVIGAKISVNLDTNKLKLYFGIFLLLIAVFEVYSLFFKKEKTK